jgi:hypothetical protein
MACPPTVTVVVPLTVLLLTDWPPDVPLNGADGPPFPLIVAEAPPPALTLIVCPLPVPAPVNDPLIAPGVVPGVAKVWVSPVWVFVIVVVPFPDV